MAARLREQAVVLVGAGARERQLLGREGLYRASDVMAEIAREITYFSASAQGVPDVGVDLKVKQLAAS